MRKKKKKRVEKCITLRAVSREDTAQKQLTNHNARNLFLVTTGCLSGGLCEP